MSKAAVRIVIHLIEQFSNLRAAESRMQGAFSLSKNALSRRAFGLRQWENRCIHGIRRGGGFQVIDVVRMVRFFEH
jgi:hypothetical protein